MLSGREADGLVPGVVDVVEALEPRVPVDEVEALAARRAQVAHGQVDPVGGAPDVRVELPARSQFGSVSWRANLRRGMGEGGTYGAGPELRVRDELVRFLSIHNTSACYK